MIPFDTRYTPDLIFATRSRLSEKFPHDTGQGVLNLMYPERAYSEYANLAHCAVIVDDYLIQFSERGNMYVLDIPTNKVSTYQIVESDISMELSDWLKNTASTAVKMMKAIEKDSEAQYFLQLYGATLFYHTMPAPERQRNYNQAMTALRQAFGLDGNSQYLRISNGHWFYGNEQKTWGNIALNIFRDYFKEFSTYYRQ